jgi:hypothetical protein
MDLPTWVVLKFPQNRPIKRAVFLLAKTKFFNATIFIFRVMAAKATISLYFFTRSYEATKFQLPSFPECVSILGNPKKIKHELP